MNVLSEPSERVVMLTTVELEGSGELDAGVEVLGVAVVCVGSEEEGEVDGTVLCGGDEEVEVMEELLDGFGCLLSRFKTR